MTDTANNFNLAVSAIFPSTYSHLWCAYHFYKAFKANIIKNVKNPEQKELFKSGFYRLTTIMDMDIFEIELKVYLKILVKHSQKFYDYFYTVLF